MMKKIPTECVESIWWPEVTLELRLTGGGGFTLFDVRLDVVRLAQAAVNQTNVCFDKKLRNPKVNRKNMFFSHEIGKKFLTIMQFHYFVLLQLKVDCLSFNQSIVEIRIKYSINRIDIVKYE